MHGEFDEDELWALAAEAGVPYGTWAFMPPVDGVLVISTVVLFDQPKDADDQVGVCRFAAVSCVGEYPNRRRRHALRDVDLR